MYDILFLECSFNVHNVFKHFKGHAYEQGQGWTHCPLLNKSRHGEGGPMKRTSYAAVGT